ncbi:hypothetical protein [Agromyces bracchium]|uniref:Secreted protein n=1 Tax=Agromyces bracchium TaxID=88376 RepID=A0A6I3M1V8_9MICO|nr:hypothetical protein [Agromyces bracchium]MTH66781.1 hypothetical protein [Agromyces bracchium]
MNTASRTRRIGPATAILLGCALAITPITAHAGETDASPRDVDNVRFVPSDSDPRGHHVVRQVVPADSGITSPTAPRNLRQQLEADRGTVPSIPSVPRSNLRQQLEADGGSAPSRPRPTLRQQIEDDGPLEPVPMPRVVPDDTDPRVHRRLSGPSEAPDVYVHQRVVGLG